MKQAEKYRKGIISILKEISEEYPNIRISTHLAMALSDYPDFDGIADKSLLDILTTYKCTKDLDIVIQHDNDIDDIIKDGMNLESTFDNEETDEYDY